MNRQIKKSISLFLLTLVLSTQVGLHFLHHHATSSETADQVSLQSDHDHQHCAVCGLDLFFAQELPTTFSFSCPLLHEEKWIAPAPSAAYSATVISSGRAPPLN